MAAADAVEAGECDVTTLEALVWDMLVATPGLAPEYAAVANVADVTRPARLTEPAFLAVAARVGATRLIDNIHLDPVADSGDTPRFIADRGVRTYPSDAEEARPMSTPCCS